MELDYYRKGRTYELFIMKAFNCKKGKRNGADESFMIALFINEQCKTVEKPRVPYDRQLYKVKMYIEKAIIKLKKRKKYVHSYDHFAPLLNNLNRANTPNDLSKVVSASLRKVIEIENQMRRIS